MTEVTVKQFAEVVGVPTDRLLTQLVEAGLEVTDENATISDSEKTRLLEFLRQSHGKRSSLSVGGASKITLKRKTQSELRATVPAGRGPAGRGALRTARPEAKTVTVEVRKKRTYVKRADLVAEEQERLDQEAEEKARLRAEEEARNEALRQEREADRKKQEEEAAAQHSRKICNIIRSLGAVANIQNIQNVEESLLEVARTINKRKKGILQRLKKSSTPHHTAILSAAIATMGKIGTANSEAFLKKIAGAKTAQAEAARKAIEDIRLRYAKQQEVEAPAKA